MSATCCVCLARVRVSKGRLIKHRAPNGGGHCENSGCDVDANKRGLDRE